jgi:hypothetical protein
VEVEMFFVKTWAEELLADIVGQRVASRPDVPGSQPNWGLPNSYDVIVADHANRRVALSPIVNGWVAGVESRDVLDFELLRRLSEQLRTDVLAVQLSDVTGSCGYAWCLEGQVMEQRFMGDSNDPSGTIRRYLQLHRVTTGVLAFEDALLLGAQGWKVL